MTISFKGFRDHDKQKVLWGIASFSLTCQNDRKETQGFFNFFFFFFFDRKGFLIY